MGFLERFMEAGCGHLGGRAKPLAGITLVRALFNRQQHGISTSDRGYHCHHHISQKVGAVFRSRGLALGAGFVATDFGSRSQGLAFGV